MRGRRPQPGARVGREPEGLRDTEMADEIDWLDLPGRWTYGVDRGGRVFFIKYVDLSHSLSLFFKKSCST